MINKFLFDVDDKGKKVLYGLFEDEHDGKIELGSEIDYVFKNEVDEENISRNLGGQCYVVFNDNGIQKYLDIDFYKDKAKIQLTEKIAYAFPISEDLIDIILDYLNIDFDYEVIYGCFYEHPKKGTVDILERQFKGLFTDSYVQIIKEGISYFLGIADGNYFLTRDLRETKKFHKSEIRKILLINKFVDKTTELKQLYFSPYQLLRGTEEFFLLYPKPMMVSKVGDQFIINTKEIKITNSHLLCKSELINGKMKEIQSLLNKEEELEKGYGLCYSKFLNVNSNVFTLSENPSELSLVSKSSISLFSSIYSMFSETLVTFLKEQNLVNVYEIEDDKYRLTTSNVEEFISGGVIKEEVYYDFLKHFVSKSIEVLEKGFVISVDDKYISLELFENNEFKVHYHNSSYDAMVFTDEQSKILSKIINKEVTKRELTNILTNLEKYNITNKKVEFNIVNEYSNILAYVQKNKYKLNMFSDSNLKLENERGSLEYLRRFFFKDINDTQIVFENIFSKQDVSNILLVDSLVNLDLIALNNICVKLNKIVNVTMIIRSKMGYFPKTNLSNVKVNAVYRVEFSSLPKVILNKFDLILFSRGFNKQEDTFNYVIKNIIESQNIILANITHCYQKNVIDSFAELFSKIKRKHFIEYPESDEIIDISRRVFDDEYTNVNNYKFGVCDIVDPIVSKQSSYHSIVLVKNKKVYDLY